MRGGAFIVCTLVSFLLSVGADSSTVLVTGDIPVGVDFSEVDYHNLPGDSSYIAGSEVPVSEGDAAADAVEDPLYWLQTCPRKPTGWMKYTFYEDADCTNEKAMMGRVDAMGKCAPNMSLNGYVFTSVYGIGDSLWMRSAKYTQEGCKNYVGMTVQKLSPNKCIRMGWVYAKYEYMALKQEEVKKSDIKEGAPEDLGKFKFDPCNYDKNAKGCSDNNSDKLRKEKEEKEKEEKEKEEKEKEEKRPLHVPRFHFDGPASIVYDSSQGCASNLMDDVLTFSIVKPRQCNKSGSHSSRPNHSRREVAYDAGLEGVDSKEGSFERTCPADEMREKMREKREKGEEEHPQGYLDEEFDYDVVTTYAKSDKCTGEAKRMERFRAHCKQITARDLWWNMLRKSKSDTCDAVSVFMSDYCGSTFPEPVLRKERFDRMKREERERAERERKDKKNRPKEEETDVDSGSSSSSSSAASSHAGTGVIVGGVVGSLAAFAMIAVGLHLYKTRRVKQGAAENNVGLA